MIMDWVEAYKPYAAQITVQACYAGMNIIVGIALDNGMSSFVFVAYRSAVATFSIAPLAYFMERGERPAMTCAVFWQISLLALCGITLNQNLYFAGLAYTSPTFASATRIVIPVITFVMATAFGLENVNIRSKRGQAKVIGTIVCVGGAMIMTLYRGSVLGGTFHLLRLNSTSWILGALMLFVAVFCWSAWIIFQTPVQKKYPAKQSLTTIILLMGTVQSTVVALIFEPNASAWKLNWDFELFSIVYTGVLCSAFAFFVQAYCISKKGPVFAVMFNPLSAILVAILELSILHVKLHVGSVVGGILIITGLYTVLWGKANDYKELVIPRQDADLKESIITDEECRVDVKQPLLQNKDYHQQRPSSSHAEISQD